MDAKCHESDERLELYALGRVSDSEVEQIEEHLLICDSCRDRMEYNALFAVAITEDLKQHPVRKGRLLWFRWSPPQYVFAGALAMVLIATVFLWTRSASVTPVATLQLTAFRGAESSTVPRAKELDLSFTDAARGTSASVEVVDGAGGRVWQGAPEFVNGRARVRILQSLAPGEYFARYYDTPGHLLHEYSFGVKP